MLSAMSNGLERYHGTCFLCCRRFRLFVGKLKASSAKARRSTALRGKKFESALLLSTPAWIVMPNSGLLMLITINSSTLIRSRRQQILHRTLESEPRQSTV